MRVRLTDPKLLDKVLAKLDQIHPLGEYNEGFIKYCVPVLKERLANGETLYLDAEIGNTNYGLSHILTYWSPAEVLTDKEYLNPDDNDELFKSVLD